MPGRRGSRRRSSTKRCWPGSASGSTGRASCRRKRAARRWRRCSRFKLLLDHMKVKRTQVVATAAIRDAEDGAEFVREVERHRLRLRGAQRRGGSATCRRGRAVRHSRSRRDRRRPRRRQPRAGRRRRRADERAASRCRSACFGSSRARAASGTRARCCKAALKKSRLARARARAATSTWSADRGARWPGSTCSRPISRCRSRTSIG